MHVFNDDDRTEEMRGGGSEIEGVGMPMQVRRVVYIFLFVTTDSFDKANAFMVKENLTLPVYQSVTNPPIEMESSTIPATYLIDQQGNIIVAKIGTADWNSDSFRKKLEEILKK